MFNTKDCINALSTYNSSKIKKLFTEKGRELIYLVMVKSQEQGSNLKNHLDLFESLFIDILVNYDEYSLDTFSNYTKACESLGITPNYTFDGILKLQSNPTIQIFIDKLIGGSTAVLSSLGICDLKEKLGYFLCLFIKFIKAIDTKTQKTIDYIISCCTPRTIIPNPQPKNTSSSMTSCFGTFNTPSNKELEILDIGATLLTNNGISFGCVIHNPNEFKIAKDVKILIKLLNETGQIIYTHDSYINMILPKETVHFGQEFYSDCSGFVNYKVSVKAGNYYDPVIDKQESIDFTYEIVNAYEEFYSYTKTIKINLTMKGVDSQNYYTLYVVFYNEFNKIVGGYETYLSNIVPNVTTLVNINVSKEVEYKDFKIFIMKG